MGRGTLGEPEPGTARCWSAVEVAYDRLDACLNGGPVHSKQDAVQRSYAWLRRLLIDSEIPSLVNSVDSPSRHRPAVGLVGRLLLVGIPLILVTACLDEADRNGAPPAEGDPLGSAQEVERLASAARERLEVSDGGRLVLRAIEAHGGLEAWYRAPTSSYTWEYANVGSDVRFKSFLVADNRTREVHHDLLTTGPYEAPSQVEARFAWDGERAWIHPDTIQQPNPRFWGISGYYFQQIPFVLADPGINYRRLPDEELDGARHEMVRAYFDPGVGESPGDS